jgi:hypothetical protein
LAPGSPSSSSGNSAGPVAMVTIAVSSSSSPPPDAVSAAASRSIQRRIVTACSTDQAGPRWTPLASSRLADGLVVFTSPGQAITEV